MRIAMTAVGVTPRNDSGAMTMTVTVAAAAAAAVVIPGLLRC